uniref:Malic enzyme n=1 Tax=Calcidiscus leptoporus TaxID=127549 RepID=A0A7S0JDS5_9EUKA|mmetsp:Transcript_51668/g.118701  ORF Transcript_51668/g.118701 Transcript_51668/m.118701 type:complete len:626 (+) Transcript_51668:1-1878(+)
MAELGTAPTEPPRPASLGKSLVACGGINKWNEFHPNLKQIKKTMDASCTATSVAEALKEIKGLMSLGHNIMAYLYLRVLFNKDLDLYYSTLAAEPALLLPVAYTPTVGEACQKFHLFPQYPRGMYLSLTDRGNLKASLKEYAEVMLPKNEDGTYDCECIVFSDGGRILGLGDLGVSGMGIPSGKLDLYTVCGGFNPKKTIPLMLDVGCTDSSGNSAGLTIRDHPQYLGLKQDRAKHKSEAGTLVNSCYYGKDSFILEFMTAATELFGKGCLLQFEDFNSNDAFPLLAEYREKFLTYNDDIQGTASVAVAAILGAIKIQKPETTDLIAEARKMTYVFHGAGSANLGGALLLRDEGGVPGAQIFVTNSKGIIWMSEDGKSGSFRNNEQKAVAQVGEPMFDSKDLVEVIKQIKPDCIIGAVGRAPNCFNKAVVEEMCKVQEAKKVPARPLVFALSNPKSQAECTAEDCYKFSQGKAIFGSGTRFEPVTLDGVTRDPGQVNNFFIFPGMSYGCMRCQSKTIPERFFMLAAEAVANSLSADDIKFESVVPNPANIREVNLNVATAAVLGAEELGIAGKHLVPNDPKNAAKVKAELLATMWQPSMTGDGLAERSAADFGTCGNLEPKDGEH